MVPEEYGDCHRFFLQEMMSVGILGTYQVQDLFDRSHKAFDEEKGELLPFIKAIQAKIRPMGMMIRKWTDEDGWRKNKNTYYVLTCTTGRLKCTLLDPLDYYLLCLLIPLFASIVGFFCISSAVI